MTSIVSAILYGGLGNQLFQIAATISFALKHSADFVFKYEKNLGKRPTYWTNFLHKLLNKTSNTFESTEYQIITEPEYNNTILSNWVLLDGYFQSPLFFSDYNAQLFKLFDIESHQACVAAKYQIAESSISIHFRRGDYKQLPECHPILPDDYYAESIQYILTRDPTIGNIYYYCEDEDAADIERVIADFAPIFSGLSWVRMKADADWEELVCMSCSKHHVIANSSFSWWGAYFNPSPDKIVCYPAKWFGPLVPKDVSAMFPEEWIKIWI